LPQFTKSKANIVHNKVGVEFLRKSFGSQSLKWKRSQQNRVNNAEDRCVGANSESESENNDRGEEWLLAENSKSVAKILHAKLLSS
jgi:hypothetical protein